MRTSKWTFLFIVSLFFIAGTRADDSTQLNEVDVIGKLDKARDSIVPSLGATDYNIGQDQIADLAQGGNASFNQVVLRTPGAAEDSFGQLHIRGEHANLQYRINDVVLPEGITGFGQELDTRFIDNVSLIDGSLPAQYGFHTAGIVDIHTKNGAFANSGDISVYGGSHRALDTSVSYGGSEKGINYFITSSYSENDLGIENTTKGTQAIHDQTQQGKFFAYLSKVIDDTSRVNLMLSASHSDFQIPDSPGGVPFSDGNGNFLPAGFPIIDSSKVNDRQSEQNYYDILTYQKAMGSLNLQASAFTRYSEVFYRPDITGDLDYNGVASRVNDSILTNGLELDASYELNDKHTIRAGTMFTISQAVNDNNTLAFPDSSSGPALPLDQIVDNNQKQGEQYGLYLQDEWKVTEKLTINYGGRFDQSYQYLNEYQLSPRINGVYEIDASTKVHGGYARYFTPPPLELEQGGNPDIYNGTTAALATTENSPVKAERANYYDLGITHDFSPELHAGLDGYYKTAHNQLDEGQFGAAPIFVPFNYKYGKVEGVELTLNYKKGGFSAYNNFALSRAMGKDIVSAQFEDPDPNELAYISNHWVHLDHDQLITGSGGVAYDFDSLPYVPLDRTKVYMDILYGSGLRAGFANEQHTGFYNPINVGIEHTFITSLTGEFKVRFDIVNLFDEVYELRNGTGIGVFAPQYGPRRGFYGGLSKKF